jgi:hypothetical protein
MDSHMNKLFLLGAAAAAAILCVAPQQRSEALGGETLSCFVSGTTPVSFTSPSCFSQFARSSYTISFILNGSGTYSYLWNTGGFPISSGCTSTSASCAVRTNGIQSDQEIPVSVTISQGGQSATLQANAFILAVCAFGSQLVFC